MTQISPDAVNTNNRTVATPLRRIFLAITRRWYTLLAQICHPNAHFGKGCDVRPGLFMTLYGGLSRIDFGDGCIIDRFMTVECIGDGKIIVGARTIFGHHCTIAATSQITIGEDCLIADQVSIRDHDHRFDSVEIPTRLQGSIAAPVTIGNNVWLGTKVTVVRGVSIGDGAVIGANSVVTRDIPAGAVAVGAPARVLRMR